MNRKFNKISNYLNNFMKNANFIKVKNVYTFTCINVRIWNIEIFNKEFFIKIEKSLDCISFNILDSSYESILSDIECMKDNTSLGIVCYFDNMLYAFYKGMKAIKDSKKWNL